MKQKMLALLLAALLATGASGCTPQSTTPPVEDTSHSQAQGPVTLYPAEAVPLAAPAYGEQDEKAADVAQGANRFALQLSAELLHRSQEENFVCSPYSVWLPLAALLNATGEPHREALLTALGAEGITPEEVNEAAYRMLYDLTREGNREYREEFHNPLQIANAVFVDQTETLNGEFARILASYYRGQAMNVDFASPDAPDAVNRWAAEHTEGLIEDIIQEFDPETVAVIANAIYFSDRWEWEFNPQQTAEDVFHSPGGDTAASYMLREGDAQLYYEDDRLQAMPLGFKSGGELLILLPKDGDAAGLLASLEEDYLATIHRDFVRATGKLLLPRFSIQSDIIPLKDALETLGVPLFDPQTAPLTGGLLEGSTPVYLSDAVQKATIQVDEKGTTAAAVTAITAATTSMPLPTDPFEMICDKPFVFVLFDRTYDGGSQILFTGVVNNPGR